MKLSYQVNLKNLAESGDKRMINFRFSIEEEIFLNANTDDGLIKEKAEVVKRLKFNHEIGNDDIKAILKSLIINIENMTDEEFRELMEYIPFSVPEADLHEEILDYE